MTLEELTGNFALLENWDDRYGYLIELGARLPPMPDGLKTDATLVPGCASQVWIAPLPVGPNGGMAFAADSDSQIVRGLIAILMIAFSGKTPQEILAFDIAPVFEKLGLADHISANRKNGFAAMTSRIRALAAGAGA